MTSKKETSDMSRKWAERGLSEKDPQRKLHYFSLALELDPYNPVALNNKGILLHKKGEFLDAVKYYDMILGQYQHTVPVPVLYNKCLALKEMGRHEAALNFLKKALKQEPENERVRNQIADISRVIKEKKVSASYTTPLPAKQLAVNQIYDRREPPAVSTLLSYALKCNVEEIKYHKGLGEDLIKESTVQEKLKKMVYCCRTCSFYEHDVCYHQHTRAMSVSPDAICRNFRP